MEKITAELRVLGLKVQPFTDVQGETLELRAYGFWKDEQGNEYPVSLHLTTYPGHGVVPHIGDDVSISVERS
jgi:hypothetical protein